MPGREPKEYPLTEWALRLTEGPTEGHARAARTLGRAIAGALGENVGRRRGADAALEEALRGAVRACLAWEEPTREAPESDVQSGEETPGAPESLGSEAAFTTTLDGSISEGHLPLEPPMTIDDAEAEVTDERQESEQQSATEAAEPPVGRIPEVNLDDLMAQFGTAPVAPVEPTVFSVGRASAQSVSEALGPAGEEDPAPVTDASSSLEDEQSAEPDALARLTLLIGEAPPASPNRWARFLGRFSRAA